MNKRGKGKKAVSLVVSYVILTGIVIAMSGITYAWLKFRVKEFPLNGNECPEDVSIIISDYLCDQDLNNITITVENRGRFNISGYVTKINNESKPALAGRYKLCKVGDDSNECNQIIFLPALSPNGKNSQEFDYAQYDNIKQIEILPFRSDEGEVPFCSNALLRQDITGCE